MFEKIQAEFFPGTLLLFLRKISGKIAAKISGYVFNSQPY